MFILLTCDATHISSVNTIQSSESVDYLKARIEITSSGTNRVLNALQRSVIVSLSIFLTKTKIFNTVNKNEKKRL